MSLGLMGQRVCRRFFIIHARPLTRRGFFFSLPSIPLIRPFALTACNGFIGRYYEEGLVLLRLHSDGHNVGWRGEEEEEGGGGGEGKKR